jgi:hypothetical protein
MPRYTELMRWNRMLGYTEQPRPLRRELCCVCEYSGVRRYLLGGIVRLPAWDAIGVWRALREPNERRYRLWPELRGLRSGHRRRRNLPTERVRLPDWADRDSGEVRRALYNWERVCGWNRVRQHHRVHMAAGGRALFARLGWGSQLLSGFEPRRGQFWGLAVAHPRHAPNHRRYDAY